MEKNRVLKKKYFDVFLCYHWGTNEFPQKMSANFVQPFGQLKPTYIYERRVLLYRFENSKFFLMNEIVSFTCLWTLVNTFVGLKS